MSLYLPESHVEAKAQLLAKYEANIQSGKCVPFTYPFCALGAYVVIFYLLIPHQSSPLLRKARYVIWAFNVCFSIYSILFSCAVLNNGYVVGLISAYAILWTMILLVVYDAQMDFKRVAARRGFTGTVKMSTAQSNGTLANNDSNEKTAENSLVWQHYQLSSFIERVDWVADIFTQFRGIGWNWQLPALPPLPLEVRQQLGDDTTYDSDTGRDGTRRYSSKSELLRVKLRTVIIGYIVLDFMKVITIHDPYFWGLVESDGPSWLPSFVLSRRMLVWSYRGLTSLLIIHTVMKTIFALGPLFFVGLLGREQIGVRGEVWMYPDLWGSFRTILDKGLAGWWGGWWHQAFRFAFESISARVIELAGLDKRSSTGRFFQVLVAFSLSGFLHASGSYSQLGQTRPLRGPFLFFMLQPFGIMVQILAGQWLRRTGISTKTPKLIRQLANVVYAHVWLYYTAPLLCDDFARGGLWLIEPVPFSPLRALGMGTPKDGWWCWGGAWVRWYSSEKWWQSGFAI
ncbi:hypothetical protein NA57DRAFT_47312 [Rhizodiscina lignyota]|uniref:Wax synthase domain-containing protein n=1 Tax=Rhizodiscina lignyota TaxID=1504668 RepID=A0A9P4M5J0_9PEZI|nr:hypothetical protein NA57DRAFT_47312 [Rhizodiscina lignyota]